jgi:serine/threonine protein kinase
MAAPATVPEFLACVTKSALLDPHRLDAYVGRLRAAATLPAGPRLLADAMVRDGLLTRYQAEQLLLGKGSTFTIGDKYRILERLGFGGMGSVYLCEHVVMRRRVAVKVLPPALDGDPAALERFRREARAVAALDHPNITRAYDIDRAGKLHFLVLEYVDGSSLQEIVSRRGPLDVGRSAHYVRQAAVGLQHAHQAGLVHRDIKPANLLLDRQGTVKILDLGLARFFHDETDNISTKYQEAVLGTADYMAPEQTLDSHAADIRADIYGLGMTWYFLLTGSSPCGVGTVTERLLWHQLRRPEPIRVLRPEVPEGLDAVLARMVAREPADRYQTPAEVAAALEPWTQTPIPPPPEAEMPRLSRAALGCGQTVVRHAPPPTAHHGPALTLSAAAEETPGPAEAWSPSHRSCQSPEPPMSVIPADSLVPASAPAVESAGGSATACARDDPTVSAHAAPASSAGGRPSGYRLLLGGVAIALVIGTVLAAGGAATWWALRRTPRAAVVPPRDSGAAVSSEKQTPAAEVLMSKDGEGYRIRSPGYEAVVEADGCLTTLRVGGVEFLRCGSGTLSRGSYFFDPMTQQIPPLSAVEQPGAGVLTARGEKGAIRYEFAADSLSWQVTNALDRRMIFYIVFDPSVTVVSDGQGEFVKTPLVREWPATTWFAGRSRLRITGGSRIWGPWEKGFQVWEATLKPRETRRVLLEPGVASEAEAARVTALTAAGRKE